MAGFVSIRNLRKSYGSFEALKGIDLDVAKGEVVCIIGPSGSGKSTILRCINGLESYDRGEISVEGARVDSNDRSIVAIRTQVSMVFQRFNLFPHRTALENVIEAPTQVLGTSKAAAREQARNVVDADHVAARAGCGDRRVPAAGGEGDRAAQEGPRLLNQDRGPGLKSEFEEREGAKNG